jgi:hypothetical protein
MSSPFRTVAQARPPAISDKELTLLARVGHDARHGLTTEAEAEWLLSVAGPLLDELLQRRAVMAGAGLALDLSNVIPLPGSAA